MYVAVTRARRRLYVTHAQSRMLHGQVRYNIAVALPRRGAARDRVVAVAAAAALARARSTSIRRGVGRRARAAIGARRTGGTRRGAHRSVGPAWRIGQSVRHAKFGVGIIIDAEGRGGDCARAGQLSRRRRQVARARVREARGGLSLVRRDA